MSYSKGFIDLPIAKPQEMVSSAPAFMQERTYINIIDDTLSMMSRWNRPSRSKSIAEQWYGSQYDMSVLRDFFENKGAVFTKKS